MGKNKKLGWILQEDGSYTGGTSGETMTPHKTRKNIFVSSKDGLMYEDRTKRKNYTGGAKGPFFNLIYQEMTVCQELEFYRKASGIVAMTSRSRGRIPPPSDQTLTEESE